jgi:hypothetical protein
LRSAFKRKQIENDTPVFCPATHGWKTFSTLAELPPHSLNHFLNYAHEPSLSAIMVECSHLINAVVSGNKSSPSACADFMAILRGIAYSPPDLDSDNINSLMCHDRLQLIIETNSLLRTGVSRYNSILDEISFSINPATELVKFGDDYKQ